MTFSPNAVRFERAGSVARLTLDAPERHNAVEAADVAALLGHLGAVEDDPSVRVLVLTGSGDRTFCSGASLAQMQSGEMTGERFAELADRLASVRVPTVCALNGSAYGGGVELALCCDFRIGVTGSRVSVPAARLGICYPPAGLGRYVTRLGLGPALRILVAHETLDAQAMLTCGLLTELVEPTSLRAATEALALRIAEHAPLAVQAMKRILIGHASGDLDPEEARALYDACAASRDLVEGLRAWRQGRPPAFEGR